MPSYYTAWMQHLAVRSSSVIFPVYQDSRSTPGAVLDNALAGIRSAYAALESHPRSVVVAGMTTGGALAVDYAASAHAAGLPESAAVLAVYPGRNPGTGTIPTIDPARIPRATRLEVIVGPGDLVGDGTATARAILRGCRQLPAAHRRSLTALDPTPAGPFEHSPLARRSFWSPLDRLIALVQRDAARRGAR